MRVLFIAWDGPQQSYLESLFLPIFARLREQQLDVHVLQFTWGDAADVARNAEVAERLGVGYTARRTSRRGGSLGLLSQIAYGAAQIERLARELAIDVLMPRSLMPAAMVLLLGPRRPIVFDADGLMADERVDLAGWSASGAPYRILRDVEAQVLRRSLAVVTRTEQAKAILSDRAGSGHDRERIVVVPNGKDEREFAPSSTEERLRVRGEHGVPEQAPWLIYAGALGPQYRPASIAEFFKAVARRVPDAVLSVFTRHSQEAERLRAAAGTAVRIGSVRADAMARTLAAADLGIALRRPTFSQRAVCPIKVAEYLMCGLPVLAEPVGDLREQLGERDVARIIDADDAGELEQAAAWFERDVRGQREAYRARCAQVGREIFGLQRCVNGYATALGRVRDASEAARR
jgi:glycosyltransferase involved in cell wall biosynthesis